MKLAFSTLGVPGMPLEDVRALALRTGWTGIEVLSSADEPVHTGLDGPARAAARRLLADGVTLLSVNSYVHVGRTDQSDEEVVTSILAEARLAADLGATAVRVFPGAEGGTGAVVGAGAGLEAGTARIVARLSGAARLLPPGVGIWLETHDSHSTGAEVAALLDEIADRRVRALWDIAHSCRRGEPWETTLDVLRPHLAHVQIKDEEPTGRHLPVPLGEGAVPVAAVLRRLSAEGYGRWVSLEWERKWYPAVAPLDEVLAKARTWLRDTVHATAERADGAERP
ncbi:sugar phosphate isomerase/epimerase family protein [Streptomyces sp. NPDC058459]|uniref:sugar phosphate isomerase/epimerase family protein n=1 Tax=Streptomyces sp. NPDC058459 TaxID=3346508 RepID=UPI0036476FD7